MPPGFAGGGHAGAGPLYDSGVRVGLAAIADRDGAPCSMAQDGLLKRLVFSWGVSFCFHYCDGSMMRVLLSVLKPIRPSIFGYFVGITDDTTTP